MTTVEAHALESAIADTIRGRLREDPAPLKLADVIKGLPKPKKLKVGEFKEEIRKHLDEEVRLGRAFGYASGKKGEYRFWSRDEKQLLRGKVTDLAASPLSLAALKTALGKVALGADGAFIEALLRELIAEDRLFEHPKAGKSASLFGASPPPPPLHQAKHKKAVDKLIADCRKLLGAGGAPADELLQLLRVRINDSEVPNPRDFASPAPPSAEAVPAPAAPSALALENLILKAVASEPVVSLADLRRGMPQDCRGRAFDEAIFHLADERRVILGQDADPSRFSDVERAEYLQDGGLVFTTISKWS